jgi:hypothetical protein
MLLNLYVKSTITLLLSLKFINHELVPRVLCLFCSAGAQTMHARQVLWHSELHPSRVLKLET